ncbi:hypothetical protein [Mucilaginibacter sp.]|jgi:hypothetical protein|uniref:hypothetical protein n=1 Tax=Mucilaginibacter sp. TaxID=1882438 RepID=UPI003567073A
MKRISIYLLPALLVLSLFATGCLSNKTSNPVPYPIGTFEGQFRLLHKKLNETKIDTLKKANIQLVLETGGAYKVLGDTATVHAGSKGQYGINATYMAFNDETYPKTGTPVKIHLYGNYFYNYDGSTNLVILVNQGDTLNYRYDLKRVN